MSTFQFFRLRFHFLVRELVSFPRGSPGNVIRGMVGAALHQHAPEIFRLLFDAEAGRSTASGLAEPPRPLIFRAGGLEGRVIQPGEAFCFDAHVFAIREDWIPNFMAALRQLAVGHGCAELHRIEQLGLDEQPQTGPCVIDLNGNEHRLNVTLRFVTPTELKSGGSLLRKPEFDVLFKRLRDRISALRSLYGSGPLEIDFRLMGSRSEAVRLVRSRLEWEAPERRSARTGQVHSIGGFTGEAEYAGDFIGEFMPWLRAARWVGVGRQTVWGKGDVRALE